MTDIEQILDQARWAPSGDNTQPWRFEIVDARHVVVHGFDTRSHCVYDLDGHPSQIALGALVETAAIAASVPGWSMTASRRRDAPDERPVIDLRFQPDPSVKLDRLAACITRRSVQRRPLQTRSLTPAEKNALDAAVGDAFRLQWLEGLQTRLRTAMLLFHSARLRLTMPEAYRVHRDIIEWNARYSVDRVPDQALGVDALTARLMRFVMQSWPRVEFFNRYLAGTWAPRLQMDFLPALACGAHLVLTAKQPPASIDDYIDAGRAVQRLWLTATDLGLQFQPELTPLIFARYAREQRRFSELAGMPQAAQSVAAGLTELVGRDTSDRALFMARIGAGAAPRARSTRRTLDSLTVAGGSP